MSASTSRYTGMSAWSLASARASSRVGVNSLISLFVLVFAGLALLIFQSAVHQSMLDDPGLGWHLRNLDAMQARGGWLTEDPFSQRSGRPWRCAT